MYSYILLTVCEQICHSLSLLPSALKTNRQRAHDAWFYERERGENQRKSVQDEVGAKTTGLQSASDEKSTCVIHKNVF